jgi:hypothetical protein
MASSYPLLHSFIPPKGKHIKRDPIETAYKKVIAELNELH